jgi:hypothetical protein
MAVSNLNRFLYALEALPALAAVHDEWQAILNGEFDLVRPFLRVRPGRAESYPHPNSALPYDVVPHGSDAFVGVCRETGETISLTKSQLVVYELDRRRFADGVAAALGIDRTGAGEAWDDTTIQLGRFSSTANIRYNCVLTFPIEWADVHVIAARLIAEKQAPLILFAPTRQWLRRAVESLLKLHGSLFVALAESVASTGPGRLDRKGSLDEAVVRATGRSIEMQGATSRTSEGNSFRQEGDTWMLTFAGKTKPFGNNLGIRCIFHLIASKTRGIDAVRLKALAVVSKAFAPSAGLTVSDEPALAAYRTEREYLSTELERATKYNDPGVQVKIQSDIDALDRQITASIGFGGRLRETGSVVEKARKSVSKAIERALTQIAYTHKELAQHLDRFIHKGKLLSYSPDPDVEWAF